MRRPYLKTLVKDSIAELLSNAAWRRVLRVQDVKSVQVYRSDDRIMVMVDLEDGVKFYKVTITETTNG